MLEKKVTKTEKINVKSLQLNGNEIVDLDGVVKDLNRIVKLSFDDGTYFDFTVQVKSDETTEINEEEE